MNINKAKNLVVSTEFPYQYTDNDQEKTETIKIRINRGKLNLKVVDKMQEVQKNPIALAPVLFDLLDGWSLTEDDEGKQPYALTQANIEALPQDFLEELATAVMETASGKQAARSN